MTESRIHGAGRWRRPRFLLQSLVAFLLLLAITVYVARLAAPASRLSIDLGGHSVDVVPESLRRLLVESAPRHLALTYFVSHRDQMPSHFKGVEERVRRVLDAVRRVAPERIDVRVIDPAINGAIAIGYAAGKKVSPISVRRINLDEHGEQKIWSSLVVAFEGFPDVLIADIETGDVSFLSGLLLARLEALRQPITPVFAVSSPARGFEQFPRYLSQHGPVVEIDLDRSPLNLPDDVDILFWFEPAAVTRGHIQALQRFVKAGRSVVLAGSSYDVAYSPGVVDSLLRYRTLATDRSWSFLLQHFGLRPVADLILDSNTGPVTVSLEDRTRRRVEAPFHLRNLPAFRDFRLFRTPARGGLSFVAPSPLQIDPQRATSAGFEAHIVATTTERVRATPLPVETFGDADLATAANVPKQNLMVLLSPDSPWSGQILALASASMFRDGVIDEPGYGHSLFVADLVRTFAAPERLVRARVDRGQPPPLPAVSTAARILWRGIILFLVPLFLLGIGLRRLLKRVRSGAGRERALGKGSWGRGRITLAAGSLAIGLSSGLLALVSDAELDLTKNGTNSLADETFGHLRAQAGLQAELIVSPKSVMPRSLKGLEDRLASILEDAGIDVEIIYPEKLTAAQRQRLQAEGLKSFEVEGVKRDTVATYQIWSALRLRLADEIALIPQLDEQTFSHLDFLLVAALRRLDGRAPLLCVISDLPRLSPAEALEDYQKKGLSAPQGADVYGSLKRLLERYGYRVQHVNPRYPQLEPTADAVLWLQPRRDSGDIILQLGDYLAAGGHAVVAMQHFNIQQRQYRGVGFETVYWPQPQFQDFDRYLRLVGVEQVREVLMDRTRHHMQIDTQVNRSAVREYDPQQVALPFLIRAVGAHFSATSPMTRQLGDLSFIWGNRFRLDMQALTAAGFDADVLVETSDQAWAFDWKGGWLPPEIFTSTHYLEGRQSLAVNLSGPFPPVEFVEREDRTVLATRPRGDGPAGSLTLIGCSELFKNDHLSAAGFDHQQFLLNAVAAAALDPQMAALQARRGKVRGFAFVEPSSKLWWRLGVTGAAPMALLLFGLLRWRRSTRASRAQ